MNKSLLLGAASVMALTACSNMADKGGGVAAGSVLDDICSTKAVRCIDVVIAGGQITQVNDELFAGPDHLILWKLNPLNAPWMFPSDGISFKPTSAASPPNEFNCRPMFNQHFYLCSNRNTVARTYTYTVKLTDGSGHTIIKDPRIINQ
jgi:hypothetical protein